jgi:hypothetical protein
MEMNLPPFPATARLSNNYSQLILLLATPLRFDALLLSH